MKKILTILLTYIVYFNSFSTAYANTSNPTIGGWSVISNVGQGIGSRLTASKDVVLNGIKKTATSSINIVPNPSQMGRFLAKNLAAAAVIGAMDLLLDGVDYVMNPENNTVTYNPNTPSDAQPYQQNVWTYDGKKFFSNPKDAVFYGKSFQDPSSEYNIPESAQSNPKSYYQVYRKENGQGIGILVSFVANPSYDPDAEDKSKPITVPISTIGEQVIEQAEKDIKSGNPTSPAVAATQAAAAAIVGEAIEDDAKAPPIEAALEAQAAIPTNEVVTEPKVDPITGEVVQSPALEIPKSCEWAPTFCQAAEVVKQAPAKVAEYVATVKDYFKEEPLPVDPTEIEIEEPVQPDKEEDTFSWNASCPFDKRTDDLGFNGTTAQVDSDLSSWCEMASDVRPFVLMGGGWFAFLIVSGFRVGND